MVSDIKEQWTWTEGQTGASRLAVGGLVTRAQKSVAGKPQETWRTLTLLLSGSSYQHCLSPRECLQTISGSRPRDSDQDSGLGRHIFLDEESRSRKNKLTCKFSSSRPYPVAFPLCLPDAQVRLPCFRVAQHLVKERWGEEREGREEGWGRRERGRQRKRRRHSHSFQQVTQLHIVTTSNYSLPAGGLAFWMTQV